MVRLAPAFLWYAAMACAASGPALTAIQNQAGASVAVAGDVIDLIGSNLAAGSATAAGWPLPWSLASTQVFCNGHSAPLLSVDPDRIRIQLPWELAGLQTAQMVAVSGGVSSSPLSVPLADFGPAILGVDAQPITPGQTVKFRVVGLGPRNDNPPTGSGPTAQKPGSAFVHFVVSIGGVPAPVASNGLGTGDAQDDAGVQVVAVQVPFNVTAGDNVPVQVQIGGVQSASFPVSVQAAAIQISLAPASAQVPLSGSAKFTASVQGSDDTALQWSIDANAYSMPNTLGSYGGIQGGVFDASDHMPVPDWTLIRATHSSGAFATALVQLIAQGGTAYRILPESPVIAAGESITFTLVGPDGSPVSGAAWDISDGFGEVTQSTYTAPSTYAPPQVNVWARIAGQYGYEYDVATTMIVIDPPRAQITGTTPAVGHVGEPLAFQGTGITDRVVYAWFTAADGSRIQAGGPNVRIAVPHGAVSGPVWLEMNSGTGGADFLSAPYQLTIMPRVRLHANRQRVSSGESIQIVAATPDVAGSWQLAWRADLGTVDSHGMFLAPTVMQPAFARIWACLMQNTECGTTVVEVLPFRLDPDPLIISPGDTIQLSAWQRDGPAPVEWQAVTANVSVTSDGRLTAGTGPFDGGLAVVSATYGGVSQQLNLSIRTAGSVTYTAELWDWLGPDNNSPYGRLQLGVFSPAAVVNGNWIYAFSSSLAFGNYGGPWLSTWLDVYLLDDRKNPVWVDSLEAPYISGINNTSLYLEGNNLYVIGNEGQYILLRYDISQGRPVLESRQVFDGSPGTYRHQGFAFSIPSNQGGSGPIDLQIQDFASGSTRTLPLDYVPVQSTYETTVAGASTWAAVMFVYPNASGPNAETVVFDTTSATAEPFAVLPSGGFDESVTVLQDLLVIGGDVYQVAGSNASLVAELPTQCVLDSDPKSKRLLMQPFFTGQEDGYRVVDLSNPASPKISATTVQSRQETIGLLGPDYFVLLNGPQNIGVYPIQWTPGVQLLDQFPFTPWMNDLRVRDGYVYWTGPGWGLQGRSESLGIFEVDDVTSWPSSVVSTMDRPGDETGWAIELNGQYAYVGTDSELIVYDISSPAAPVQGTVIPAPAVSLALLDNYLYARSNSGSNALLLVYDVSNPAVPRLVGSMSLPDFAYGIAGQAGPRSHRRPLGVQDAASAHRIADQSSWLALAMGTSGLAIYSLGKPAAPALLSHFGGTDWGVAANNGMLYAAADSQGLLIYDLTHPANPAFLSQTSLAAGDELAGDDFPTALAVSLDSRGIAWLCTSKDGRVYGLDTRQPDRPRHIAEVTTLVVEGSDANTFVWNGDLFVAGNDAAFDMNTPQNVGLYEVTEPAPGQVLPDRYGELAPVAQTASPATEPLKSRVLHGRYVMDGSNAAGRQHGRPYRANRPDGGPQQRKR